MNTYFRGVSSVYTPSYSSTDVGSGRCRLSTNQFNQLKIQLGWILELELYFNNTEPTQQDVNNNYNKVQVLCTAYPHTTNTMNCIENEHVICIDDTVYMGTSNNTNDNVKYLQSFISTNANWTECNCMVRTYNLHYIYM